jgi:hypothetical protein
MQAYTALDSLALGPDNCSAEAYCQDCWPVFKTDESGNVMAPLESTGKTACFPVAEEAIIK